MYGRRRIVKDLSSGMPLPWWGGTGGLTHKHTSPHPSVKVSAWFLLSCLPRNPLCGGRILPPWVIASCSPIAYIYIYLYISHIYPSCDWHQSHSCLMCWPSWLVPDEQEGSYRRYTHIGAYMDMHINTHAGRVLDSLSGPHWPPAGPSTGLWWAVALIDHL